MPKDGPLFLEITTMQTMSEWLLGLMAIAGIIYLAFCISPIAGYIAVVWFLIGAIGFLGELF